MSRRGRYSLESVDESEELWSILENSRTRDSLGASSSNIIINFSDYLVNSTGWNNVTSDAGDISLAWTDFALVFLFCCIISGTVIGNTLVIAAVATTRRLRTVTNCFVMSLAVADWLVGMFVMPPKVGLHLVDNKWHLGRILCELWISLDILLCTASILSLCAISIDRYLAITRPLAYSRKRRSKRLALSMISCVWVAAVVITSPPIFGWYDSNRNVDLTCEYNENTGYVVYSALGSFFLPLLVMLYVYARIACVISQRHKTIEKLHQNAQKRCCEDHEGGREETATRVLDSLDEHKIERSSSSSASHTIGTPNSPAERDIGLWSRLHCTSSKGTGDSSKSERGCKQKFGEQRKGMVRSNTVVREHCRHEGGRIRTGSRLCHHSISTLSPQRSIHRAKSATSTAVISFSDGDLSVASNMRNESSRVWTIEGAEHASGQSHKLNGRVRGCSGEASSCDNGRIIESSITEMHSRIYPTQTHHASTLQPHCIHQPGHFSGSSGGNSLQIHTIPVHRRSMKSNVSLHVSTGSSDQNQNSAAVATSREFTSGRMASFKRETKTAQTLAAVVGGFIICWLPFFVAYVIGPFIPEGDKIPVPLMDALIWLGWGNSAINPFIYAFYSPDFRSAFWRLTFHKFEGLLRARRDGDRNSPRRYDDTITGMRTSN